MSDGSFLSTLRFFRPKGAPSACREAKTGDGWTQTRCGQREWEALYRRRWQYDKKVRSTHEPRGYPRGATYSWYTYSPAPVGGTAGIVGGLGAFGRFVLPPVMGMFVKFNGPAGYAQGFSVFLVLSLLAFGFIVLLAPQTPLSEAT